MAKLKIKETGNAHLDGEYELDFARGYTKTEYFLMKSKVGIVIDDLQPGSRVDANVLTAWGIVALHRAQKDHLIPAFMETDDSQTDWDFDTAEVEDKGDGRPPESSVSETSSENGSSGVTTRDDSVASPETPRLLTGVQS